MYNIGDMVFYGGHGVCEIEEITEMTISNQTKKYYRLKSNVQPKLQLFHPVETNHPKISKMITEEQSTKILAVFEHAPSEWIQRSIERAKEHKKILDSKDHLAIAQMINTILRKQAELEEEGKKLYAQDQEIIRSVMEILCDEISISLNISKQEVFDRIDEHLNK